MRAYTVVLLFGIFGTSLCLPTISDSIWTIDTEQTKRVNQDGITFFRGNKHNDKTNDVTMSNTTTTNNNNNNKLSLQNKRPSLMHAFSHFMPDQNQLSRAAGLSRAAKESSTIPHDKLDMQPTANHPKERKNNFMSFAPKHDIKIPFTREIIGFESTSNKVANTLAGSEGEWEPRSFDGNNGVQQIDFSQLGIMNENIRDIKKINTEFEYLNSKKNGLSNTDTVTNDRIVNNGFLFDSPESSYKFDNAEIMQNNIDKSGYIFNNITDATIPDKSSNVGNGLVPNMFPSDNIEVPINELSTGVPSMSSLENDVVSNGNSDLSSMGLSTSDNSLQSVEMNKDVVKPFPFGQIQGNSNRIHRRGPTLTAKNDFVDHSRKPILKVKSAFVDLSGRQNPNMKPLGTFVDMSDKLKTTPETAVKTAVKSTLPPSTPSTTTEFMSRKPIFTTPSPVSKPGPVLTGLGLPGTVSENPDFDKVRNNRGGSVGIKQGKDKVIPVSRNNEDINSGIMGTTSAPGDNLKVDMLYPPAPFPAVNEAALNTNTGQSNNYQPTDVPTTSKGANIGITRSQEDSTKNDLNPSVNTRTAGGGVTETLDYDYDYDMYADVPSDTSAKFSNSMSGSQGSQQTSVLKDMPKIPLVNKNAANNDHFKTDPNVQVINPNNNIPRHGNAFRNPTGLQNIGQNQQMFPNGGQDIFSNNLPGSNAQIPFNSANGVLNRIQPDTNPGQFPTNSGQIRGNNILNHNQLRNSQTVQSNFPQNQVGLKNQLNSIKRVNSQNNLNQNEINSNPIDRFQGNQMGLNNQLNSMNGVNSQNNLNQNEINSNPINRFQKNQIGLNNHLNSMNSVNSQNNLNQNEINSNPINRFQGNQIGLNNQLNSMDGVNSQNNLNQNDINSNPIDRFPDNQMGLNNQLNSMNWVNSQNNLNQNEINSNPIDRFQGNQMGLNNQLNSINGVNSQNNLNQNGINSNPLNRFQENLNTFPTNQNFQNNNEIQNDINLQNRQMLVNPNSQRQDLGQIQANVNKNIPIGNQSPNFATNNNQNNAMNGMNAIGVSTSNQFAPSQSISTDIQRPQNQFQNNLINNVRSPAAGQGTGNFNGQLNQLNQIPTNPGERQGISNLNTPNQFNSQNEFNGGNLWQVNQNSVTNSMLPNLPNSNTFNNNFQNGPIVTNGVSNGQLSTINNFPSNQPNLPISRNGLPNTNAGENMATNLQSMNNLAGPQMLNNQQNQINFGNDIQQLAQNNQIPTPVVRQNGQNLFQNGQQQSFGNIPNNLRNVINRIPPFQANILQNQNNFLNNGLRNGLNNNFRSNLLPNSINMQGLNRFPGNRPLNTNQFGTNFMNGPFGPFR